MKVKNKKSNLADMFASRRNKTATKKSPFEMHINRAKQTVLGRKLKSDAGLPGVSRSKAIQKRKQTLLQEFKVKDKDNLFYDKRIGERNRSMTEEEKTTRRLVHERLSRNKSSVFNLNDEEILTHRGQSVMDIEKFDDPRTDEDSEDEGRLDTKFVEEAHFGGGLLESKPEGKMSHRDLIDTLISESKKRKAEKKKQKEQAQDLTEKLDAQWKDLLPLITAAEKTEDDKEKEKEKNKMDDYDKLVRQMKYDRKAVAGEKLKSQEDMDAEEKKRLEKLEAERLARMEDEESRKKKKEHKSADDLDFDYFVEKVDDVNHDLEKLEDEENDEENEEDDDEEEENQEDDDKEEEENEDDDETEEKGNNEDENEKDSESEDDLADLKESSSDEEPEIEVEKVEKKVSKPKEKETKVSSMPSESQKKLESTYQMVASLEELENLLSGHGPEQMSEIILRMIKANEKTAHYKEQFGQLFNLVLLYLDKLPVETEENVQMMFKISHALCRHLYSLAHVNPEECSSSFQKLLKEKQESFQTNLKIYPSVKTILLLKVAGLIFPSSDFRHPIMTPCHVFMTQILLRSHVKTASDLAKGLFICTLLLENTTLSNRFAPSTINFIRGVLYSSLKKDNISKKLRPIPTFKHFDPEKNALTLESSRKKDDSELANLVMTSSDLIRIELDDDFKVRVLATTVGLLNKFIDILQNLEAAQALFKPILEILKLGVLKKHPKQLRELGKQVDEKLTSLMNQEMEFLVLPKKKPKALKLYEPKIEPVYEGKRNRPESRELAERQKMAHKLKMETKNAKREIRRDNIFLAKHKISNQIKSDTERKRKVNEIVAGAAVQQCELKKFKKK